ncbi:hypothetical protein ACFQ1S_22330, partial [Kibdelosporangium lantanae]
RVTALRALSRGDGNAHRAVRTVLESARAMTDDGYIGGWFTHMEVPVWRLATALLDGSDFATAQRDALLAHRQWWAHTQANPGEPQDLDPHGYLSLGVTCFTALQKETGGDTVDSEYVPRLRRGPGARPGPSTEEGRAAEEVEVQISDEELVAELLAAVRTHHFRRVEDAFTPLSDGAVRLILDAYSEMTDLREKELVQVLLHACAPLELGRPVFADILTNADAVTEHEYVDTRVALSMAMSGLEVDRGRFIVLMRDDDAFDETFARLRHHGT